jgi:hypothetical protein
MIAAAVLISATGSAERRAVRSHVAPPGATVIRLGAPTGRPIPSGFLGLSLEYSALRAYAGTDPTAVNPVLEQLIRNLTPGQAPDLRIGGDSTDWAWFPTPGLHRPRGVRITITHGWIAVARALTQALGARLILGIDLEAGSRRLAATEAGALVQGLGRTTIEALEPGNEPELYPTFAWYVTPSGRPVKGRPPGYDFAAFTADFKAFARVLPPEPLAGPATGALTWMAQVPSFLASQRRLKVLTLHRYPLQQCYIPTASPLYPTVANLLAPAASQGLADSVARYAALAHASHRTLRIDEMNTVSCGSGPGVADAFASALWGLDASFQMARVGVDGINLHSYPGATYQLFRFRRAHNRWQGEVAPEYYGLMMFALAAPPKSRLLTISTENATPSLHVWATKAPDGHARLVLINDGTSKRTAALNASGSTTPAILQRLTAPSLHAKHAISLGGQSFAQSTTTGTLAGRPASTLLTPTSGRYVVTLPGGSALLLTL